MAEKMIRVQFSLPLDLYSKLRERAVKGKWSLSEEIRGGLRYYLAWTKAADEKEDKKDLPPLDLTELWEILEQIEASGDGVSDSAENHDKYIYGDPHGEKAVERERLRAQRKSQPATALHERPAVYRTKRRRSSGRKGKHK